MGFNKLIPQFIKNRFTSYLGSFVDNKIKNYEEKPRYKMIELAMDFCSHNKVEGHYFEFGVWRGDTFQNAFHAAQKRNLSNMHFFAFDSFQGFSVPQSNDDIGLIKEGNRACTEKEFINNMSENKVDLNKVTVVPGWFSDTLTAQTKNKLFKSNIKKVAIVYIDCDLYVPAIACLNFITDIIVDGTVLIFDDWFYLRAHSNRGERKAFTEWRNKNPQIKVTEYANLGWHGKSFILNL